MSFEEDKKFAELGEAKCLWLLHNSRKTRGVLDVRYDAYFQALDIDFLQLDINDKVNKIEVKTDRQGHQTGNFVYETQSHTTDGCLNRSHADYIYYYLCESNEVWVVSMPRLRKWLEKEQLREVVFTDGAKGYLIKFIDMEINGIAIKLKE